MTTKRKHCGWCGAVLPADRKLWCTKDHGQKAWAEAHRSERVQATMAWQARVKAGEPTLAESHQRLLTTIAEQAAQVARKETPS
jgi:hypothetical protein